MDPVSRRVRARAVPVFLMSIQDVASREQDPTAIALVARWTSGMIVSMPCKRCPGLVYFGAVTAFEHFATLDGN